MNRRSFIKTFFSSFLISGISLRSSAEDNNINQKDVFSQKGRRVPLLQCGTSTKATSIIVLVNKQKPYSYKISMIEDAISKPSFVTHPIFSVANSRYGVQRLDVEGLVQGVAYSLKIFDSQGSEIDDRTFFTLKDTDTPNIGFLSCFDDRISSHPKMWSSVLDSRLDLLVFLGDSVYADDPEQSPTQELIWNRYLESRLSLDLYQTQVLTPTVATWDDHDLGEDNAGADFRYISFAKEVFENFFGVGTHASRGPGISQAFSAFNSNFLLLDGRSFLKTKHSRWGNSPNIMWGENQIDWAKKKFNSFSGGLTWVISGSQFFGGYSGYDSAERDAGEEFKELKSLIKAHKLPTIFVSGDRHFSEIMRIEPSEVGYQTLEITSSSLHSENYFEESSLGKNKRRDFATSEHNFVRITPKILSSSKIDLKVEIIGGHSRKIFSKNFYISK